MRWNDRRHACERLVGGVLVSACCWRVEMEGIEDVRVDRLCWLWLESGAFYRFSRSKRRPHVDTNVPLRSSSLHFLSSSHPVPTLSPPTSLTHFSPLPPHESPSPQTHPPTPITCCVPSLGYTICTPARAPTPHAAGTHAAKIFPAVSPISTLLGVHWPAAGRQALRTYARMRVVGW
ncbi:uncharacterized protein CC84DRAFT_557517 [Paraphaeosphaeria sporulosa]|uniref:Uncharacterized protein n=1 Tax=Paraphaeosphaeria sporulosa TaxID=1460663 RepID=A0A177CKT6_9PLEO|nr:uncharacterized protein CC84DRAFT_557517 [Paraphaeosphaeria sporulosa]OAG08154.1 hypothetical protein CC84DRAFT_557517 [Paraphaeosphaeria sporulosa]